MSTQSNANVTGVAPVATEYQVLELVYDKTAGTMTFYINGTSVGVISSGLPTGGLWSGGSMIKSAGATNLSFMLDAIYLASERLSVR